MEKEIINIDNKVIVNIYSNSEYIYNYKSAIKFFDKIAFNNNSNNIIVNKEIFSKNFFKISNNLFNRLFKYLNRNNIKIAIIGDFSIYENEELLDYIYSINKENLAFFLYTKEEAIYALKKGDY